MVFADRREAGQKLSQKLSAYANRKDVVIYALPRGGVVTGIEIARALQAPLDLLIPRKIGHPDNPEYAICALNPEGDIVCGAEGTQLVDTPAVKKTIAAEKAEAKRRQQLFLRDKPPAEIKGKTAIIVDDGIATGLTMKAAIASLKHRAPKEIIVAVPVTPSDSASELETLGVKVIAILRENAYAGAVASYYKDFPQVENEEVIALMNQQETK